jgi:hypothetical protein
MENIKKHAAELNPANVSGGNFGAEHGSFSAASVASSLQGPGAGRMLERRKTSLHIAI